MKNQTLKPVRSVRKNLALYLITNPFNLSIGGWFVMLLLLLGLIKLFAYLVRTSGGNIEGFIYLIVGIVSVYIMLQFFVKHTNKVHSILDEQPTFNPSPTLENSDLDAVTPVSNETNVTNYYNTHMNVLQMLAGDTVTPANKKEEKEEENDNLEPKVQLHHTVLEGITTFRFKYEGQRDPDKLFSIEDLEACIRAGKGKKAYEYVAKLRYVLAKAKELEQNAFLTQDNHEGKSKYVLLRQG